MAPTIEYVIAVPKKFPLKHDTNRPLSIGGAHLLMSTCTAGYTKPCTISWKFSLINNAGMRSYIKIEPQAGLKSISRQTGLPNDD